MRVGRIAIGAAFLAIPIVIVFVACGGSESTVGGGSSSGGQCPPCEAPPSPACRGTGPCGCGPYECPDGSDIVDSGAPAEDSGSSRQNPQEAGTYMGFCMKGDDGGFRCNDGLTCRTYGRTVTEGGTIKGCQERVCTQRCDSGCPAPATGCGLSGFCDPEKCVP